MMLTVILQDPKFPHNVAAAIRAAACFGADRLWWSGSRVQFADRERLPREERMKGYRAVKFEREDRPFTRMLSLEEHPRIVCGDRPRCRADERLSASAR